MDDFEKHVAWRLSQRVGIVDFGTPENPKSHIEAGFWERNAKRPEKYAEYKRRCFVELAEGKTRLGSFLVGNDIRWRTPGGKLPGDLFKVRNDDLPYYPRLFVREHPEHYSLFVFKRLKYARLAPRPVGGRGKVIRFPKKPRRYL